MAAGLPLLSPYLLWRVAFVSVILMLGTFGLYLWQLAQDMPLEQVRTVAVNTLVMFEIFYLFNARYTTASVFNWAGFVGNRFVLIAIAVLLLLQFGFTYLAPMQAVFGTMAIDMFTWLQIIFVASSVLFLVELEKYWVRHKLHRQSMRKSR